MSDITAEQLAELASWDTPTICNALEIASPARQGHGFSVKPFLCMYPGMKPIVGFARTATIRAAGPDLSEGRDVANRLDYYAYVAECDGPSIVVIQDLDPSPGVGAFWGEVNTAVHKGLGALGVITNGSYRDIPDSADEFQVLGGMVGPSHAFVHAVSFGEKVMVHGMSVEHGDLIHADQHGAVVVPREAVELIRAAVKTITAKEGKILAAARAPGFGIEALRKALSEASEIH